MASYKTTRSVSSSGLALLTELLLAVVWQTLPLAAQMSVRFNRFCYTGRTEVPGRDIPGTAHNPILAGMYPDPSIVRNGSDFYLVNSSFAYFPGVPIFHSRDLAHWQQIGSVLTRTSQFNAGGIQVSRGIFAPTIRFHNGTYYMITTDVDGVGNFYVTATNPAGPWSNPVRLPQINGIDPSFFFDEDGKAYIVHNGPPPDNKPLYDGHRAIWLFPFDTIAGKVSGPGRILVNGGVDITKHPAWIEGPHLFHRGGFYYLIAAEGGTSINHSEVVFRAETLDAPFVPYDHNPILTQRDLPAGRSMPIADTGHADFTEDGHGNWYATFLGVEPYEANYFNTGRETFLLPVTWVDDWPVILPEGHAVPRTVKVLPVAGPRFRLRDRFVWTDDFHESTLKPEWEMLRTPDTQWYSLEAKRGSLVLNPGMASLTERGSPSFLGHRQQHAAFTATILVQQASGPADAGLALFQNEHAYFFLAVRTAAGGASTVLLLEGTGTEGAPVEVEISRRILRPSRLAVELKIVGQGATVSMLYRHPTERWQTVATNVDATILSTAKAGGFVGTFVGPYARLISTPKK